MATSSGKSDPVVLRISAADVVEALVRGLRDFQALPFFGLLFGALYAAGGILIVLSVTAFGMVYLAYPLAAGFALIGPFVAIGLYEVSRCREAGRVPTLHNIWRTMRSRSEIGWMAFVTLFIFILWMYQARLLVALFLGVNASFPSLQEFIATVLTTSEGLIFLMVGNMIGAALALILFSLTVVSLPLLLDRDVDFVTAMITSVRAVVTSPVPMVGWAAGHRRAADRVGVAAFPRSPGDAASGGARYVASLPAGSRSGCGRRRLTARRRSLRSTSRSGNLPLVSRFRSSHHCAAPPFANFGIEGR